HIVRKNDVLPFLQNMEEGAPIGAVRSRLGYITNVHEKKNKTYRKQVEINLDGSVHISKQNKKRKAGVFVGSVEEKDVIEVRFVHTYAMTVDDEFSSERTLRDIHASGYKKAYSILDKTSFLLSDLAVLHSVVQDQEPGKGGKFHKYIDDLKSIRMLHSSIMSPEVLSFTPVMVSCQKLKGIRNVNI
ncbi:hypothetical protein M3P05_19080, partial [Sansalvadorimonas sp. 2012CJ34-2]